MITSPALAIPASAALDPSSTLLTSAPVDNGWHVALGARLRVRVSVNFNPVQRVGMLAAGRTAGPSRLRAKSPSCALARGWAV